MTQESRLVHILFFRRSAVVLALVFAACIACSLWPRTATAIGLCPRATAADSTPVLGFGPDDLNCSVLSPATVQSAPFVVKAVMERTAFSEANQWNYVSGRNLEANLTIDTYSAWVVDSPDVRGPSGNVYNRRLRHLDVGGAVFAMTYTPRENDPSADAIHFLQIYSQSRDGGPTTFHVDNNNDPNTPFYDQVPGAAVERDVNGTAWFMDTPFECENPVICTMEGIAGHYAKFQFGVYIAVDDNDGINPVHNVTIYGGKQWGYKYSSIDTIEDVVTVTEPSTVWLFGLGVVEIIMSRVVRHRWARSNSKCNKCRGIIPRKFT